MHSYTTLHQQQNLLTFPGSRGSTATHQLKHIRLQYIFHMRIHSYVVIHKTYKVTNFTSTLKKLGTICLTKKEENRSKLNTSILRKSISLSLKKQIIWNLNRLICTKTPNIHTSEIIAKYLGRKIVYIGATHTN